jgi:hypothetical protein
VLVLNGCDDGDLIQEDINFQDIATQVAPQWHYFQTKRKEALLLEIPSSFVNEPSLTDTNHDRHQQQQSSCLPLYNGIVSNNNICETIAPATTSNRSMECNGWKIQIFTKVKH